MGLFKKDTSLLDPLARQTIYVLTRSGRAGYCPVIPLVLELSVSIQTPFFS